MINKFKKHKDSIIILSIYTGSIILLSIANILFLPVNVTRYLILILTLILVFILSFKSGKKRTNKGYLAGIKTGLLFILIVTILDLLIVRSSISFSRLFYYLIIILISIFGSIIGINKKAN